MSRQRANSIPMKIRHSSAAMWRTCSTTKTLCLCIACVHVWVCVLCIYVHEGAFSCETSCACTCGSLSSKLGIFPLELYTLSLRQGLIEPRAHPLTRMSGEQGPRICLFLLHSLQCWVVDAHHSIWSSHVCWDMNLGPHACTACMHLTSWATLLALK